MKICIDKSMLINEIVCEKQQIETILSTDYKKGIIPVPGIEPGPPGLEPGILATRSHGMTYILPSYFQMIFYYLKSNFVKFKYRALPKLLEDRCEKSIELEEIY